MKLFNPFLLKPGFSLFSIIILGLMLIFINANPLAKPPGRSLQQESARLRETVDVNELPFKNHTSAFNVVVKDKTPEGVLRLVLQNMYDKKITAFETSLGSTSSLVDTILSTHDDGIYPGATREQFFPIDIDPELEEKGIAILAVTFEDGTSDGHPEFIKEIQDHRLGKRIQMSHVLSRLNQTLNLPDDEIPEGLTKVQSSMLSASDERYNALPLFARLAINDIAKEISLNIEDIKRKPAKEIRSKLAAFIDYSRSKSDKLKAYLERVKIREQQF